LFDDVDRDDDVVVLEPEDRVRIVQKDVRVEDVVFLHRAGGTAAVIGGGFSGGEGGRARPPAGGGGGGGAGYAPTVPDASSPRPPAARAPRVPGLEPLDS